MTDRPAAGRTARLLLVPGAWLLAAALWAGPAVAQELRRPAAAEYDVVALRVEFRPDTTRFTTGDGTFGPALFDTLHPTIDPLPHDAAYFEAHLEFLRDYVARVSDGRTVLREIAVLPEVVRLDAPMSAYSPIGERWDEDPAELARLARLARDAWHQADAASDFDPSGLDPQRTAYVLFHAGAGRDLELVGTTLDKTPEDIPSFFLSPEFLARHGQGPITFKGRAVEHTILLPETESRTGYDFIGRRQFLLELSINGLLAASFFNFLGVPDLFDTATGESAIGPFGLMDPLGFFAYAGLFPPEPSPWTKLYLGWIEPERLDAAPVAVALPTVSGQAPGKVALAPVSEGEFFLVENRQRDPEGDGLVLRVLRDGRIVEERHAADSGTFNRFDQRGFGGGVVLGADSYDWALPGGPDEDGVLRNGGILIWHVDERRIRAGLAENRVNADSEARGLDVEEADGAQDLGNPSGLLGGQPEIGTPFDYFYEGNPVRVVTETGRTVQLYRNRFGPDTYPDSRSNAGGPSFVVLRDFSPSAPVMRFTYERAPSTAVAPVAGFPVRLPGAGTAEEPLLGRGSAVAAAPGDTASLLVYGADRLFRIARTGGVTTAVPVSQGVRSKPVLVGADRFLFLRAPAGGEGLEAVLLGADGAEAGTFPVPYSASEGAGGVRLVSAGAGPAERAYAVLGRAGAPALVRLDPAARTAEEVAAPGVGEPRVVAGVGEGGVAVIGRAGAAVLGGTERWAFEPGDEEGIGQPVFGRDRSGLVGVVPLVSSFGGGGALVYLHADGEARRIAVAPLFPGEPPGAGGLSRYPVLADLDRDGLLDVLFTYGDRLAAVTPNGALVASFPRTLPAPVLGQPLLYEQPGGGRVILVAATDGYLHAFDAEDPGALVEGFPLAAGLRVEGTPLLQEKLSVGSAEGTVSAWRPAEGGRVLWGELYGDPHNRGFVELPPAEQPAPAAGSPLLVDAETYNWPNPVREGFTHLRVQLARAAAVEIVVSDLAGQVVDRIEMGELRPDAPAEVRWTTDAPSGLYFARVRAVASDGGTDSKLIKIAVIR